MGSFLRLLLPLLCWTRSTPSFAPPGGVREAGSWTAAATTLLDEAYAFLRAARWRARSCGAGLLLLLLPCWKSAAVVSAAAAADLAAATPAPAPISPPAPPIPAQPPIPSSLTAGAADIPAALTAGAAVFFGSAAAELASAGAELAGACAAADFATVSCLPQAKTLPPAPPPPPPSPPSQGSTDPPICLRKHSSTVLLTNHP